MYLYENIVSFHRVGLFTVFHRTVPLPSGFFWSGSGNRTTEIKSFKKKKLEAEVHSFFWLQGSREPEYGIFQKFGRKAEMALCVVPNQYTKNAYEIC